MEGTTELIPAFQSCVEREDYIKALQFCSEIELAFEDTDDNLEAPNEKMNFYCSYMAIYLITGDLNGARYLWRRISSTLKINNSELANLWNLGKCLWLQDFKNLKLCFNISWSANILPYVLKIKESVYARNLRQISEAYSIISLVSLGEKLMLTSAEAINVCCSLDWTIDCNAEFVSLKAIPDSNKTDGGRTYEKDVKVMLQLSSYVADFEKKNLKIDTNIASGVGTGSVGSLTGAGNKKSNFF